MLGDPAELRPVPVEAMHLTLAFLGERPGADVEPLADALARSLGRCAPPRAARAVGGLWLSPRRPHVLTAAVEDPSGALAAMQDAVSRACARAVGWEPERRAFRPHVTVARARRNTHVRRPRPLPALPAAACAPWTTGGGVALLRSSPAPGGSQYASVWSAGS